MQTQTAQAPIAIPVLPHFSPISPQRLERVVEQRTVQKAGALITDRELVDMYVGGNESCLAVLLDRHKTKLFSFIIRRARSRDLAEDVFQETCFKAIRSLKAGMYNEQDKFI